MLGPILSREQEIRNELVELIQKWELMPDREACQPMINAYKEMLKKFL
jgi:hypothetical protein